MDLLKGSPQTPAVDVTPDYVIETDVANAAPISFNGRSAAVILPASNPAGLTQLTFYAGRSENGEVSDGAFYQIYNLLGDPVTLSVGQGRAVPLPDEIAGFAWFKIVGDASGGICHLSRKG